jgi:hypothetical protein
MGWGPLESRIEKFRENLARDPSGVVREITTELDSGGLRPRDLVRLLTTRASGRRQLADYDGANEDLEAAGRIPKAGAIARCEITVRMAELRLTQAAATGDGWSLALGAADQAILEARQLSGNESGNSDWAIRQARSRALLLSSGHHIRAQVLLLGYSEIGEAFVAALSAAQSAPKYLRRRKSRRHPQVPACSLIAVCAMRKGETGNDLQMAQRLVDGIAKNLPAGDVIPRAQIRATQACILAGKGHHQEAELMLRRSLDDLRRVEAWTPYGHILTILLWVVRDCQERPERAEFLSQQLAK